MAGTILGAALTYVFQERSARRAEATAFGRELRTERRSVYSAYLTALAEWRRGLYDWCNRRWEDPGSDATFQARVEAYRLRGLAQAALSEVELLACDPELTAVARNAQDLTALIRHAEDGADLEPKDAAARAVVRRFIALASAEVQTGWPRVSNRRRSPVPVPLETADDGEPGNRLPSCVTGE